MREIELKFELSERDAARLAKSPVLGKARPRSRRMHAIYFDTPDHALAARAMALRLRDEGGQWVQCLKAGGSGTAGLHAREEWEWPRGEPSLDSSLLRGTPLESESRGLLSKLAPAFEVEMDRTTWELAPRRGARVEVALDRGHVRRGRQRAPICEVEIESVEGEPLAVFDVAAKLLREVPMRASATSKAQRGYALSRRRAAPRPAKATAVVLDEDATIGAAARAAVAAALAQLQANERLAAGEGADEEYLHQFRVGLRRLRAALRTFRDAFEGAQARAMRSDCRWLSRSTGHARDWDVFTQETLPTLLRRASAAERRKAMAAAGRARDEARRRVREALDSPRYARFVLRFARWLAQPDDPTRGELHRVARKALQRQHRKSMRALRDVATMAPDERHRLRVRLKRLRYACEALASLFGRERDDPYVKALAALQSDLGGAADARVAMGLARRLRLPPAAHGMLRAAEAESLRSLAADVEALRTAGRFWHAREG